MDAADRDGIDQDDAVAVIRLLLDGGTDPDQAIDDADDAGLQPAPLLLAAQRGHAPVVEALLEGGADPELVVDEGSPPLSVTAAAGHLEVVGPLVDAGADPAMTVGSRRWTPADVAGELDHDEIVAALDT
jgi:ankyrin repeat protein